MGTKDLLDGAKAVVELATGDEGTYESGFWQMETEDNEATIVSW